MASGGVEDKQRKCGDLLGEKPTVDVLVTAYFLADGVHQLHVPDLVLRQRVTDALLDDLRYVGGKLDVPFCQVGERADLTVVDAQQLPQLLSEVQKGILKHSCQNFALTKLSRDPHYVLP